jgi:hypothetical protein
MVMVVMMVIKVVVVMVFRGERRAGKYHQEQYGGKNLLHGTNLARTRCRR